MTRVYGLCGSVAAGQVSGFSFLVFGFVELALKRKLSFPVSRMWQWWVRRSRSAVVILASPNTPAHSLKLRLVVMTTLVCS